MRENLEKNIFAYSGVISTIAFWYCVAMGKASDVGLGLLLLHSVACYALSYLRKKNKYVNLKEIELKRLEISGQGVIIEMQDKPTDSGGLSSTTPVFSGEKEEKDV